jgi:hypothetical protein
MHSAGLPPAATEILRYLDSQGRPDRQVNACDIHASELSASQAKAQR